MSLMHLFPLDVAVNESRVFYLLFTYIAFAYQDSADIRKEVLIGIWNAAMRFVKMFINTKTPSSIIWLLEILFLLSVKYIPKELLGDAKFKKELHEQINALLMSCAIVCAKTSQIHFNDPNSKEVKFKVIFPLPPTVYEMYRHYHDEKNRNPRSRSSSRDFGADGIDRELAIGRAMFEDMEIDFAEHSLYVRYRLFCFKTLRRVALNLIQNTYAADRTDRVAKRVSYSTLSF